MLRFPSTLLEFQAQFPDEASCWTSLRRGRWPHGFRCPRCESRGVTCLRSGDSSNVAAAATKAR